MHKYLSCSISRLPSSEAVAIFRVSECLPGLHPIYLHWFGTEMTGAAFAACEATRPAFSKGESFLPRPGAGSGYPERTSSRVQCPGFSRYDVFFRDGAKL